MRQLRERGRALGFSGMRIASAEAFEREREALVGRIASGFFDGMGWFTADRARVATDPALLVPGARALITVALPHPGARHVWRGGARGRIARYAWSLDYHGELKARLGVLRDLLRAHEPAGSHAVVVDTGRIVDRAVAARAGLGWYGKNAMVLTPEAGSWVMLGEIVTTIALPPDPPLQRSCGQCTLCLSECPTGAIVAPGAIDSRRCISYLTIEHEGAIPRALRPLIGQWIFGCDICQEVCPVNERAPAHRQATAAVLDPEPELAPLLELTRNAFKERYFHTPVGRAGWVGFLRNVCVALGNARDPATRSALIAALGHAEGLVRGHAAWALGRLAGPAARAALAERLAIEEDPWVREEIDLALR